jgi:hypothetical protein
MITSIAITGAAWTPITTAGQAGTMWPHTSDNSKDILLYHTTTGLPDETAIPKAYHVTLSRSGITPFTPDNATDVYYARCSNPAGAAVINVDVN